MTTSRPDGSQTEPSRVIASLARDQVNLDLKTVDLCFLAGLYLRADKAALVSLSFEEDVLIDTFRADPPRVRSDRHARACARRWAARADERAKSSLADAASLRPEKSRCRPKQRFAP